MSFRESGVTTSRVGDCRWKRQYVRLVMSLPRTCMFGFWDRCQVSVVLGGFRLLVLRTGETEVPVLPSITTVRKKKTAAPFTTGFPPPTSWAATHTQHRHVHCPASLVTGWRPSASFTVSKLLVVHRRWYRSHTERCMRWPQLPAQLLAFWSRT